MSPRPRPPLLLAAALLAGAACGSLASADLQVPTVCIEQGGVFVPGAAGAHVVLTTYTVGIGGIPLLQAGTAGTSLHLERVVVAPSDPSVDLSGVRDVVVQVVTPGGNAVQVLRYAGASSGRELVLTGDGVDVAPDAVDGALQMQLGMAGQLPASSWTAVVTSCVSGTAHVTAG